MSKAHTKYGRVEAIDKWNNQKIVVTSTGEIVHLCSGLDRVRGAKVGDIVKLTYTKCGSSHLWLGDKIV